MTDKRTVVATIAATTTGVGLLLTSSVFSPAVAAADQPSTVIQLGDSFSSGEGAGWKGNASGTGASSGNRQGTDMAARQRTDGTWRYDPELLVYDETTYRERDGWWGDNPCHKALDAPITRVSQATKVLNLACSGARSKNIWRPAAGGVEQHPGLQTQLEQLKGQISSSDDVQMVVIGVGGNDIRVGGEEGFANLVKQCMTSYAKTYLSEGLFDPQYCKDTLEPQVGDALADIFYNTRKTVDEVRSVLAEEGQPAGSYKLVLMGYPEILPTEFGDWKSPSETAHYDDRCPIRRPDSTWVNNHLITRLNGVLQSAAEYKGVGFIDMSDAFAGHRLCEAGILRGETASTTASKAEWVRYLDVGNLQPGWDVIEALAEDGTSDESLSDILDSQRSITESFHPNDWGQQAIGNCIASYFATAAQGTLKRCYIAGVGPNNTPEYMMLGSLAKHVKITDEVPVKNIGAPLVRSLTIPAGAAAGHYVQVLPDITHPRKGQLKIVLRAPTGKEFILRDFNNDTGAWGSNAAFIQNYLEDPSGTWTIKVWDNDLTSHNGTLNRWTLKAF